MSKKILQLVPVMQSVSLLADSEDFFNKEKKDSSDYIRKGIRNIVSISLLKETANLTQSF